MKCREEEEHVIWVELLKFYNGSQLIHWVMLINKKCKCKFTIQS